MMYFPVKLETEVEIREIVAVHYFEYVHDFIFLGEQHNFWEVVYADKDYLSVTVRSTEHLLPPGHFLFIAPMEFHTIRPGMNKAANAVLFSFVCDSEKLYRTADRILKCDDEKKEYISKLISASQEAFSTPLSEPYSTRMIKNRNATPGAQNLVKIYLELFVLSCIRENDEKPARVSPLVYTADPLLSNICSYLEENVCNDLSFDALCSQFQMSKTNMKSLFRQKLGMGAMEYFSRCKIDCAKHLIREKEMNFTQISDYLAFTSPQYFSRRFKEISGMTPSEYMKSVL